MNSGVECLNIFDNNNTKNAPKSYSILRVSESENSIENYLLIPIEKAGFIVIRQIIEI
jgi:hypothetical protein